MYKRQAVIIVVIVVVIVIIVIPSVFPSIFPVVPMVGAGLGLNTSKLRTC